MEFSNPSIIRRASFTFCKIPNVSLAFGRSSVHFLLVGKLLANPNPEACQQWLDANWTTLTPANYVDVQEAP